MCGKYSTHPTGKCQDGARLVSFSFGAGGFGLRRIAQTLQKIKTVIYCKPLGKIPKFTEETGLENEVVLGNVMVDCDDEKKLQTFYAELLGWESCELFARPAVRSSTGVVFLFIEEDDYVRPVWPEKPNMQQKQIHFDFQVDCVAEMVKKAERLGAVKAEAQFGGDDFVTMIDPSGHPFCLCAK